MTNQRRPRLVPERRVHVAILALKQIVLSDYTTVTLIFDAGLLNDRDPEQCIPVSVTKGFVNS